jgi:hypothetical protein
VCVCVCEVRISYYGITCKTRFITECIGYFTNEKTKVLGENSRNMELHNLCSSSYTSGVAKLRLMSRGEENVIYIYIYTYMADKRMYVEDLSENLPGRGYFGGFPYSEN